jgi:hypothetical protein
LLTHNCYFFAQTIIMIAVRKTVVCRTALDRALDKALKHAVTWQVTVDMMKLRQELWSKWRKQRGLGWKLGQKSEPGLGEQLELQLEQEQELELE